MRQLAFLAVALSAASLLAAPVTACPTAGTLGTSKTVEIDTTGGPGFGFEQYKVHDFLGPKEIVLTFDDGPWPSTKKVLDALDAQCVKATFFTIGKHALYYPEIIKDVAARGHTVGTHTWSHADLSKLPPDKAREEIEKGLSAVRLSLGAAPAPFFRFPSLKDPAEQLTYLGTRNIAIFSHDLDSFDFKIRSTDGVVKSVMQKLEKKGGKGIILMHDFQAHTAQALPQLLTELQKAGYKVVHMKPKFAATTLAEFDESAKAEVKGTLIGPDRPTASIVKTVPTQ